MAAPRKTVDIQAVKKALSVWGIGGKTSGNKFIELVQTVEQLNEGEIILRAQDLTEEHIGATLCLGGKSYILDDIDFFNARRSPMAYPSGNAMYLAEEGVDGPEEVGHTEYRSIGSSRDRIVVVLDSKIRRLHKNSIVVLSNLPD